MVGAMVLSVGLAEQAFAAACCAGSSSMPGLMTGDQAAQVSLLALSSGEYALSEADGSVAETPLDLRQQTTRTRLDASMLLSDLWQIGVAASWVMRPTPPVFGNEPPASLLGDTTLNLAYEALPEFGYSAWKPRGHVFAQVTIPTGRSIHEAQSFALSDVSGQGVYALALGASFAKNRGFFDAYAIPMAQWSPGRVLEATPLNGDVLLGSQWSASILAGLGINPGSGMFRLGARLLTSFTSGRSTNAGGIPSESLPQWIVEPALEGSALLSNEWTLAAQAADNGLLGLSRNIGLSRSIGLSLIHRWER
jgi:hypothetical protein